MFTHRLSSLSRLQAFGFHFLASATVIAIILGFVKLVWYPHQLFEAANGFELLKILVLVDLILGPLIMLIIFNPTKKSLKFDVSAVLICQLLFLGYGVWSLYTARPVYIAFVENQFFLVKANEIEDSDLNEVQIPELRNLPLLGPKFVGTNLPNSKEIREKVSFLKMFGMGIQNFPQHHVLFSDVRNDVRSSARQISELDIDKKDKEQLEQITQNLGKKNNELLFIPLTTRVKQLFVIIDAKSGSPLRIN